MNSLQFRESSAMTDWVSLKDDRCSHCWRLYYYMLTVEGLGRKMALLEKEKNLERQKLRRLYGNRTIGFMSIVHYVERYELIVRHAQLS